MAGLKLHGRQPWGARRRGRRGGMGRGAGGPAWGGGGLQRGAMGMAARSSWLPLRALCCVRAEPEEGEKEEERRGKKRKEKKEKNMENFPNLKKKLK
jgi:hypothetical protein